MGRPQRTGHRDPPDLLFGSAANTALFNRLRSQAGKGRTRVSVSGKANPPGKPAVKPASPAEMRAWGREHGFKVNPRGSVSRRLRQEYQAAQGADTRTEDPPAPQERHGDAYARRVMT
jgi:hypothetical protein